MTLRQNLLLMLGLLLWLNLCLAFGSMFVLMRMSPTLEEAAGDTRGVRESSLDLLGQLARRQGGYLTASEMTAFANRLAHLQGADAPPQVQATISEVQNQLFVWQASPEKSPTPLVNALMKLSKQLEQAAHVQRSQSVDSVGRAGAWGASLLALLSCFGTLLIFRRLDRDLLAPIAELTDVLNEAEGGDPYRRCTESIGGERLRAPLRALNRLLDRQDSQTAGSAPTPPPT